MLDELGRLIERVTGRYERRCIDLRFVEDGWHARFTSAVDDEAEAFQAELLTRVELALVQRLEWVRSSPGEHRLLQLRDPQGMAAMQIAVWIDRPRRMPALGRALTPKLGPGTSPEAESIAVRALTKLAREAGDLVSLRLQPYRRDPIALRDFEARARRAGFRLVDPVNVTRTLLVDLTPGPDQILVDVSKKTRAKIKHKARLQVDIRELTEARYIEQCIAAANASFQRTGGGETRFDFQAAFGLVARHPDRIRVLGLFLKDDPDRLVAYTIGCRHGEMAEYMSAGSLDHADLRSMPFNYWLVWELLTWAHNSGAHWLDLGGVTDGGPGDSRAGISNFKRHFTELDVELGRELSLDLQPARGLMLTLWNERRQRAGKAT